MFDEGRLTIRVVRLHNAPHDALHDGLHNSFKEHFFNGIMMFCIAVIFDVSAQLGRLLTSRLSSRLINKSSTKS